MERDAQLQLSGPIRRQASEDLCAQAGDTEERLLAFSTSQ
jgi:hypothetical protein